MIATLLLTTFFGAAPPPRFQSPIESAARELLANFVAGRFEAATSDFNDSLRPIVTKEVLAGVKAQMDDQVGPFLSVKEVHQRRQDGFRNVEMIASFTKAPVSVVVVFDSMDRVGAVYFNPILSPPVDPSLESSARELLTNMQAGHFTDAVKSFDGNMRAQLTPAALATLAGNLAETYGTFRSVDAVHQELNKQYRVIDLTLSYTKRAASFRVAFDGMGRIAALHISPFQKE
jgi:hypothetical protein